MIFKLNWASTQLKLNLVCNSLVLISEIGTTNNPVITETQCKEGSGGGGGAGAGGTLSTESVERGGGPGHHIIDDTILFTVRQY